jgi:hypothetical protein
MKDVMILTGAGQIGMSITRRMGYGKKIINRVERTLTRINEKSTYFGVNSKW